MSNPDLKEYTYRMKSLLQEEGFQAAGIARAEELAHTRDHFLQWLEKGYHGTMKYMENHVEKRLDPRELVPGALSVVTILDFYPSPVYDDSYKIAAYAKGKDYHTAIRERLHRVAKRFGNDDKSFRYRVFTDSAPVMDKVWAVKAGLGWTGKNTCLINNKFGSFCFIGHIICNREFEYDEPSIKNYCGTCTRCMDACPTEAIIAPGILDARKCISYLTIENRSLSSQELKGKTGRWIFGCDICQEVCPWNSKSSPLLHKEYLPTDEIVSVKISQWENLTEEDFEKIFRGTAVHRTGFDILKRNIEAADLL
ncbi:MAG: tRNA epoxyqueuosine(34) reductase QueG [Bacteroidetes bacterium]|nr:tRNA epoxyqueuosine(34) reductase QueG [Bacteroidota bacterium]